jgi:hypothetical protein
MDDQRFIIFSPKDLGEASPSDAGRDSAGAERRRHQRYRVGVLAEIEPRGARPIPGVTFNMSRSGALLLTLEAVEPGEEVRVNFIAADNQRAVATGRVVHRTRLDRGLIWSQKIGVEFIGGSPSFLESELRTLQA